MMAPPLKSFAPLAYLGDNKPGTPQTRAAANTYLPGYGPAGGKGERNATKMLTGG
jgi:hypothetical protein